MDEKNDEIMNQVERLIKIMHQYQTKSVCLEMGNWKVNIEQGESKKEVFASTLVLDKGKTDEREEKTGELMEKIACKMITAPLVGTFYRSSSPQSDPYVEVGDQVKEGQTLCIVEAMKVMNEIRSEISGTITRIFVENGEMVEFGQSLFEINIEEGTDNA